MPPRTGAACVDKRTKVVIKDGGPQEISKIPTASGFIYDTKTGKCKLDPDAAKNREDILEIRSYAAEDSVWVCPIRRQRYKKGQSLFCTWKMIVDPVDAGANTSPLEITSTSLHPFLRALPGIFIPFHPYSSQPQASYILEDEIYINRNIGSGIGKIKDIDRNDSDEVVGLVIGDQVQACTAYKQRSLICIILEFSLFEYSHIWAGTDLEKLSGLRTTVYESGLSALEQDELVILPYHLAMDFMSQVQFLLTEYPGLTYTMFYPVREFNDSISSEEIESYLGKPEDLVLPDDPDKPREFIPELNKDYFRENMKLISQVISQIESTRPELWDSGEDYSSLIKLMPKSEKINQVLNCEVPDLAPPSTDHIVLNEMLNPLKLPMYNLPIQSWNPLDFNQDRFLKHFIMTDDIPTGTLTPQGGMFEKLRLGYYITKIISEPNR